MGLEYVLGSDWSLYAGVHLPFCNGQAWANGQPFTLHESAVDIPLMLRHGHWYPLGLFPRLSFETAVGPYYGFVTGLEAHEIPGVPQPLAHDADAGWFDYHHLGVMVDLRGRLMLDGRNEFSVGLHITQNLLSFGADDKLPIVPRFSMVGISIGFSRPIL